MSRRYPLLQYPGYVRFWSADAISVAGSSFTMLAIPFIAEKTLDVSTTELGVLRGAGWLPYLLFGLLAGVFVDRHRRQPILVGADFTRAGILAVIPIAAALDALTLPVLLGVVFAFGAVSMLYDAAHQSFPPALVPKPLLTAAWARLEQSNAVAGTGGPPLAGGVITLLGAPIAMLIDAVSYLVSGILLAGVRPLHPEVALGKNEPRNLRREIREGLAWVYHHEAFRPFALSSHLWMFAQGMLTTLMLALLLDEMDLSGLKVGIIFAAAGIGAVFGSTGSESFGRRFGVGPAILACRWLSPITYATVPLAGDSTSGLVLLCAGQFVFGISLGLDGPIEMGYRQSATPPELLGRLNATLRSLNRGMIVIGAPLGGFLGDRIGLRPALWIGVGVMVAQAVGLQLSRFRHARITD
ncbi:MFS transporter [Kribbella sp. NPDC056861]|uniref:MFS transporter n=1 Tax=Kribbella sp. NPDC056861 TaxID=3154857 RepID=UPI003413CCDF